MLLRQDIFRRNLGLFGVVTILFLVSLSQRVEAQGGCGSVCIPLEALDPLPRQPQSLNIDWASQAATTSQGESVPGGQAIPGQDVVIPPQQIDRSSFRVTFTTEFAHFKNFREGSQRVTNPGGNKAFIVESGVFVDYFAKERLTLSLLATHVKKSQFTNNFQIRRAIGLGDIAAFGRYEVIQPCCHGYGPSIWLGLGLKFPTGSIDEPIGQRRLPPAFQVGSGAHDLIPSISYYQRFDEFSLFGSYFARLPIERSSIGYRFGQEHEIHFGIRRPLRSFCDKLELLLSLDYLKAYHDSDFGFTLPARVRNGALVLNTGGSFLSLTPGVSWNVTPRLVAQARLFLPVHQKWNGQRARNVGQVAPDFTTQFTVSYLH